MKHAELIFALGHQPMVQRPPVHHPARWVQIDTWARFYHKGPMPPATILHRVLLMQEMRKFAFFFPVSSGAVLV